AGRRPSCCRERLLSALLLPRGHIPLLECAALLLPCKLLLLFGELLLFDCVALGIKRDFPLPPGNTCKRKQRANSTPRQSKRSALLPHLLRKEVILWNSANCGCEVRCQLNEAAVLRRCARTMLPQIDPSRLCRKPAGQHIRQWCPISPRKVAIIVIPN